MDRGCDSEKSGTDLVWAVNVGGPDFTGTDGTLYVAEEFVSGGKLTEKGLAELKEKMPHTDISDFESDPDVNKMADLFTVSSVVNFIDIKINNAA